MSNSSYGNSSISALKDEQQVRQRPAVIFGTNDVNGCAHSIFEIIANSIDEAREGYGDLIELEVSEDNVVTVRDNGRGVPMDWNESEGKYNWELVFCTLYASGKYDASNYSASLGLNGLGATATQYASEFMRVISRRDGKRYEMEFEVGRPKGELKVEDDVSGITGTEITFKPDRSVFTDIDVAVEFYIDKIRRQAMLHPSVTFIIRYKGLNEVQLHYEDGIKGFIDEVCNKQYIGGAIKFNGSVVGSDSGEKKDEYKVDMGLAITFSRETYFIEMYHNGAYMKDANENVTDVAIRNGVCKVIEEMGKELGKISKNDRVSFKDVEEIMVAVGYTSCAGNKTYFKNQTKTAINNPFIYEAYYNFVHEEFKRWAIENKGSIEKIISEVLLNRKARESAEAVKRKVIKKLTSSIDNNIGSLPDKFVECDSRNPKEREVYIVEGDSACGSCKQARDARFQAIMPVRGKIMNCLKEDLTRILNSEIITDLIKIYGCGVEVKSRRIKDLPEFDINKLNWSKIIFCTDADLDGMQIRCLLITMIYRLMPSLLKYNKVFIAETPLFEIIANKETYFAYNEAEKVEILNKLEEKGVSSNKIKVNRSKGLGENDPEMMSRSTMHPATRRLVPIEYIENDEELSKLINALLGDDIESRRSLINEYFDMEVDID